MTTVEHLLQTDAIQLQLEAHRVDMQYLCDTNAWGWDRSQPYMARSRQLDENPLHLAQAIIYVHNLRPITTQPDLHFQFPHNERYICYVFDRVNGRVVYADTKRDEALMREGERFAADLNTILGVLI